MLWNTLLLALRALRRNLIRSLPTTRVVSPFGTAGRT